MSRIGPGSRLGVVLLAMAGVACASVGGDDGMTVTSVKQRGPYLDVVVGNDRQQLRAFTRAEPTCAAVLEPEALVAHIRRGPTGGRFEATDGTTCDAIGIGDPWVGRSNQPRGDMNATIPRGQATFSVLHEDTDVLLLRGRFPLTGRVGWAGGEDSVAVVANIEACQRAIEGGVASIEFRPAGRNTLALVSGVGLCRIDGLITPVSGR